MKRGLASPWVHSALAMTRRLRHQLSSVDQSKSLKRRAGLPFPAPPPRLHQLDLDLLDQPIIAREPEHVVDPVFSHQAIKASRAKPEVGPKQDAHPGPAAADTSDDALDLLDGARRRIDVGAPELGGKQMPAAEDVERQIAVAVVVAVEEAAFLMPVQGVIGSVEVEDDLLRRAPCASRNSVTSSRSIAASSCAIL